MKAKQSFNFHFAGDGSDFSYPADTRDVCVADCSLLEDSQGVANVSKDRAETHELESDLMLAETIQELHHILRSMAPNFKSESRDLSKEHKHTLEYATCQLTITYPLLVSGSPDDILTDSCDGKL
ncbi:Fibrinogen beta chain [Frankliniella fusca]|uniref:Fibrinogen beta chain n=1 Tax=Frankliniella fusca TaxID=407009 RepID=A0AAE1I4K6_9NEOP|nr:Fibrinogen beta chain [Frankliniella fusca]